MSKKDKEMARALADMDQASAFVTDNFPKLWHGLFARCKEEGFTEPQALEVVKSYIEATLGLRFIGGGAECLNM